MNAGVRSSASNLASAVNSRVRAKNRTTELQLAEFLGLSGNSTKARLWVERAGDLSSFQEARLFTLAQLGDLTSARKIFDELEKASLKLAPSDRFVRLPRLVASARLLGEPARERRMLELAGMTDFKLEADWLMRIGDLDGALAQARASRPNFNRLIAFYGYFMLRHQATRELPWIYGGEDELPLILTHLIRLNRARQPAATLEVPYPRSTPATFRESINVTYPEAMVRSGLGGEARIIINVDDTGRATGYTTVTTPNPAFAEAMFKAAAEKGFHPALERGRPVAGTYEMTRNFRP